MMSGNTQALPYKDLGELSVDDADEANVPVDIWLVPDPDNPGGWRLRANNYMPRRGRLSGEDSYDARSESREVLVALVHKHWLPLYQAALKTITELKPDNENKAYLYYWEQGE
jgi:hypothetical protein